jgi:hypothetical protein
MPIISNPPDDPEERKMMPIPNPAIAPPKMDERMEFLAIGTTGITYKVNEIVTTERIV